MDQCCEQEGEARFRKAFPHISSNKPDVFRDYLLRVADRWGPITQSVARGCVLRTVDQVGFISVGVRPLTCPNGHNGHLVVVGERLYFFIWRVNMLVADFWTLDETHALVPKHHPNQWPTDQAVKQLENAVAIYFGKADISQVDFPKDE